MNNVGFKKALLITFVFFTSSLAISKHGPNAFRRPREVRPYFMILSVVIENRTLVSIRGREDMRVSALQENIAEFLPDMTRPHSLLFEGRRLDLQPDNRLYSFGIRDGSRIDVQQR